MSIPPAELGKRILQAVSDSDMKVAKLLIAQALSCAAIVLRTANNGGFTPLMFAAQRLKEKDAYAFTILLLDLLNTVPPQSSDYSKYEQCDDALTLIISHPCSISIM